MNYTIKKVESLDELKSVFKTGFIDLFDECFNCEPYFLKYPDFELWDIYKEHYNNGFVLLAYNGENKLVGFAGSRELAKDEYIGDDIKSNFPDIENYYYHSDLGVAKSERGKGLAQALITETIKLTPNDKKILMRTKNDNEPSIKLHKKMGFYDTGITGAGNSKGVETDIRVYLVHDNDEYEKTFNPTNLRVNIERIKYNLASCQNAVGDDVEIMPVLKAHAYGIGFKLMAEAIQNCKKAGVATVAEALKLRKFYKGNIFLLYQPCMEDIPYICENGFSIGISNNFVFLEELNKRAVNPVKVHINIETGSGMLGVQLKDLEDFCKKLKALENLKVNGIYMHYSCTESEKIEDIEYSNKQSEKFEEAIKIAESVLGKIKYKHAGCSSATFLQPITRHNLIRIGMLLHGYYPSDNIKQFLDLKPALKLTTKIIQIAEYEKGYDIGYGRTYTTTRKSKIATIGGGYADGFHRTMQDGGGVIVNGQFAPFVGKICMDIAMIDITDIKGEVNYNDEVALWDNENITIFDFAKKSNTNIAECMVHVGQALNCVVDNWED